MKLATTIRTAAAQSTDECFDFLYGELRRIARGMMLSERSDHTLSATALVNEAYLRLSGSPGSSGEWESRGHFISAAAESMRRILIEKARAKGTKKRSSGRARTSLDSIGIDAADDADWIIDLNDGLVELESWDAQAAELVKLRLFCGLTTIEAGRLLGMSRWVSYQTWDFARAWFAQKDG